MFDVTGFLPGSGEERTITFVGHVARGDILSTVTSEADDFAGWCYCSVQVTSWVTHRLK